MNYYRIHILTENESIYNSVTEILNISPASFGDESYQIWTYAVEEKHEGHIIDFVNLFMDILEPKLSKLEEIGINRDDISIWRIYEYDQQCAMEITPQEMKRMGKNGITLCIDCFEKTYTK